MWAPIAKNSLSIVPTAMTAHTVCHCIAVPKIIDSDSVVGFASNSICHQEYSVYWYWKTILDFSRDFVHTLWNMQTSILLCRSVNDRRTKMEGTKCGKNTHFSPFEREGFQSDLQPTIRKSYDAHLIERRIRIWSNHTFIGKILDFFFCLAKPNFYLRRL